MSKKIESGRQMVPEDGTGVPRVGSIVNTSKACALVLKRIQSHTGCIFFNFAPLCVFNVNASKATACALVF